MSKVHIEKNSVQETLVIPLYARKLCTEQHPNIFSDEKAIELIAQLDYDFSDIEARADGIGYRFGALETAMRQLDLQFEVKEYLAEHPNAAVVNLGCGLDQTGESCENGSCHIYNIDFPDVIAVRNQLIPAAKRVSNIAADLNEMSWFDQVDASQGVVFFAAGVFYYFQRQQVQALVSAMADRFVGGKLVFDAAGKRAVKIMVKKIVKNSGIDGVGAFFYVNDIESDVRSWLPRASVSSRGYMLGYSDLDDPSVRGLFRFMARLADKRMKMQIVRIDF